MAPDAALSIGPPYFAARKAPSKFPETQRCQADSSMFSTAAVGPAIPALAHIASSRPQVF